MFVVPTGIQTVLFPWLVTIKLELGATELGLGQMALQLPALFLILIMASFWQTALMQSAC